MTMNLPSATVSVVVDGDIYNLVEKSLGLIEVRKQIRPGHKVFIKPNLVRVPSASPWAQAQGAYEKTLAPEGDVIHRETLEALMKVISDYGVRGKDIIVGEAPGGCEAHVVYKALGLYELVEGYDAKLVDLNEEESVKIPVRGGCLMKEMWIPKVVIDADYRINLGVLKVQGATAANLCLKNWGVGIPPGKYYGLNKAMGDHRKGLENPLPIHRGGKVMYGQELDVSELIVDVCSTQGYDLGILEGLTILDYASLSAHWGFPIRVRRKGLMVASCDMVAIDAVGARILGLDPSKVLHIKWAAEKGLGIGDLSNITVTGNKMEEVQIKCNPMSSQKEVMSSTR